jgi:hypothetical protein
MMAEVVELAEWIKWWDALDVLTKWESPDVSRGLAMARDCRHPDAVWLASLFPAGVTHERMMAVLLDQRNDPRATYLACMLGEGGGYYPGTREQLAPAAERGYAPAQAVLADLSEGDERFMWSQKAEQQCDRFGKFLLGLCYRNGEGCAADAVKATELLREAAELGHAGAMRRFAELSFGETDVRRWHWLVRAASLGYGEEFVGALLQLLPSFEKGENARILLVCAPAIRGNLDVERNRVFGDVVEKEEVAQCLRLLELHDALLSRARRAVVCWSMVGKRHAIVKDLRVMIGKMAWEELWRWSSAKDRA